MKIRQMKGVGHKKTKEKHVNPLRDLPVEALLTVTLCRKLRKIGPNFDFKRS